MDILNVYNYIIEIANTLQTVSESNIIIILEQVHSLLVMWLCTCAAVLLRI